MGTWTGFLLTYLLGGITFIPLLLVTVLLHAYITFPVRNDVDRRPDEADDLVRPGDDTTDLKAALKAQKEENKVRPTDVTDVAAGYFAVCREYTPMGINARPIERSTPVGSTTVAAPSQSVYQTMYRTIFDRKQSPGPLDNSNGAAQRPKKAGNVFYVVLRHGHLMLFDDDEQHEVRHVISLAHHDVSIYSGGDTTPEGELFIKRNALSLTRKTDGKDIAPDTQISKPFYLFSENCSAKEDFYFALLRNQEQVLGTDTKAPQPQHFDVKNIISLVQRLHSSEEHVQTRWLNAFIGRIFLGIYKTRDIENLIVEKITKKISRVKRPSFLTGIAIQKISTGESAPYITNPRLKDLTVEGECVMEADVKYTGNFRLEVAATARIDLGSHFKVREVNLVLAVVLKKLEGHVLFKIKPPPSNRIWFSFVTMPKMEMSIEPIVSMRQITYTVILRQIENRIKEVVAETLVHPFWDDVPFFRTEHKQHRGGIFAGDDAVEHSEDHEELAAALGHVDEVIQMEETGSQAPPPDSADLQAAEKSHGIEGTQSPGFWSRRLNAKKVANINVSSNHGASASTSALDTDSQHTSASHEVSHPVRADSFSASSPALDTDPTRTETYKHSASPPDGDDSVSSIVGGVPRSLKNSPFQTPASTPSRPASVAKASDRSSNSSTEALATEGDSEHTPVAQARRDTASSVDSASSQTSQNTSPAPSTRTSIRSATGSIGRGLFSRRDTGSTNSTNSNAEQKRITLAAVANAATTAKRWGWNAIQRHADQGPDGQKPSNTPAVDLKQPMGRGQPLPPPGTPLPGPDRRSKATPLQVPKRKPMPPPEVAGRENADSTTTTKKRSDRRVPPPPLPRRRRVSQQDVDDGTEDNVLVVEAPADSEPNTPLYEDSEQAPAYMRPWVEDSEEMEATDDHSTPEESPLEKPADPPQLPRRPAVPDESVGDDVEDDDEDGYANWMDETELGTQDSHSVVTEELK